MFSNCFKHKNACFEVFFGKTLKFTFQFLDLASVCGSAVKLTKSILGSAFQNIDVTLTCRLLKDSIFNVDVTGF